MTDHLLTVSGLGKRFGGFTALTNIDLRVAEGERVGLIGPNGSGKSTLVNCLCGVWSAELGQITFGGRVINKLSTHQRAHLGMVRSFQLPRPFPTLTLAENVSVAVLYSAQKRGGGSITDPRERCLVHLEMLGLAGKADQHPRDLTQIELRKLELARALASEPRLLIVDEAMAGLSRREADDILQLLLKLNGQGVAIIMIEHIMRAVMAFSERLVVLVAGLKIADGLPQDVIRQPDVVAAYLGR